MLRVFFFNMFLPFYFSKDQELFFDFSIKYKTYIILIHLNASPSPHCSLACNILSYPMLIHFSTMRV